MHSYPTDFLAACKTLVSILQLSKESYQIGVTKVFLRQNQFLELEKRRYDIQMRSATLLQKRWRGWYHRNEYRKLRKSSIQTQKGNPFQK